MKKTKINIKKYLTISTLALIPFLAFAGNPAHAENARYQTEVSPSLRLTIPADEINITVDPSSKPFDSKALNIVVATNNLTGYNLTMSSDSVNLIKTNDDTKTIPTLTASESGYTQDTFETNKWGYKIGSGNYIPFVSGTTVGGTDTTTNSDTTTLTFAAKVDFLQSAGEYKTTLNFMAVANPLPVIYAQDLDFAHCPTSPLTVVDKRDNEEYIVQHLADGNCWMLDNLRLDPTEVSLETLQGNTNATDETLTYYKNGGGTTPYPADGVIAKQQSGTWYAPYVITQEKNTVLEDTPGAGSGKVGVFYNVCALSAGSSCNNAGISEDLTQDVCPAGWRVPTGGNTGEYKTLYNTYAIDPNNSDYDRQNSYSFVEALSVPRGGYNGDTTGHIRLWSSTHSGSSDLYVVEGSVDPYRVYFWEDKMLGNQITTRCILKKDLTSIEYLQDVTTGVLNNTAIGTTATLKDRRDEEEYVVGKLADGNLWMLDNLRLDPTEVSLGALKGYTNASDETLEYLKNGGGTSPYPANGVIAKTANGGNWSNSHVSPYVAIEYKDTTTTNYGAGSGKIGVYYNYCAASAGSYCYAYDAGTGNAAYDICPQGWRLPTGGTTSDTTNEFNNLYLAYSSDHTAFKEALGTPLSGDFVGGSALYQGSGGFFWSSTFASTDAMHYFNVESYGVNPPGNGSLRYVGFSVRCIFNK